MKGTPFSCGGGEIRDKMGINPNVYMHAVYIFSGGLNKTYIMAVSDNAAVTIEDDENALRIDGTSVMLDGISVDKTSGASSDAGGCFLCAHSV